ncbi:MAG: hypothetical protein PHE21_00895 [Candidatus Dojkabacteria bacterium]|nr:hypothetical protein [Candidatus Dojkabacteria bacterium]
MISLILFFLFNPISVYADDFNVTGDTISNSFFHTTAITTTDNLTTSDMSTIFDGMRRYPNILDSVAGKPGTKIYLWYMYSNNTGHMVDIKSIAVPLSRLNSSIVGLVDIEKTPIYGKIQIIYNAKKISRESNYLYYNDLLQIPDGEKKIYVLDTWYIKDPLQKEILDINVGESVVKIKILLKNTSDEYWNNISFKHYAYEESFDMPSKSEKVIEYQIPYEQQNTLDGFEVYNPNTKMGCTVLGSALNQWYSTQAITVFAKRENDIWIQGSYVQPECGSFCIQRLPYTTYSDSIKIKEEEVPVVVENIPSVEDRAEVLGVTDSINVLPKTGAYYGDIYILIAFLVIDTILWYSFLRRLHIDEHKGKDPRLCTKSCKNIR